MTFGPWRLPCHQLASVAVAPVHEKPIVIHQCLRHRHGHRKSHLAVDNSFLHLISNIDHKCRQNNKKSASRLSGIVNQHVQAIEESIQRVCYPQVNESVTMRNSPWNYTSIINAFPLTNEWLPLHWVYLFLKKRLMMRCGWPNLQ